MDFNQKILDLMNQEKTEYYSVKRIAKLLAITSLKEIEQIEDSVYELRALGEIVFASKSKFVLLSESGLRKGKISGNKKGFAFFRPEEEGAEDYFIPNKNLNGAFHGDVVLAGKANDDDEDDVGYVNSILQRGMTKIVGKFEKEKSCGFVIPDDTRYHSDIYIPKQYAKSIPHGVKVVAEIMQYPMDRKNPEGKVIEVLGNESDVGCDVLSIVRSHGIKDSFEEETKAEAKKVPTEVSKISKSRRDFRDLQVITIDGEDSRDLDDAISISKNSDGTFVLGVHIADVTHYVKEGSALDKEAFERATSVYFVDRVIPMIPKELSNGICSLNEGVDRLTLSCIMHIDNKGAVLSYELCKGVISSCHRMTYSNVTKILNGDKKLCKQYKDIVDMLEEMRELAHIMIERREKEGNIDFETPEAKIILDEMGKVVEIKKYDRSLSNRIIEEFMILANRTVAEAMNHAEVPCIYRIHEEPNGEKIENFVKFVNALGVPFRLPKSKLRSKNLADLLNKVEGNSLFPIINKVMLRSMQKAKYSPLCSEHFGLSADYYCHFTSPIRRYPDLFTHRMIKKMLAGTLDESTISVYDKIAGEVATNSSERERAADEAERESDDLKKTEYMARKLGQVFDGVISGVTSFGIFVELDNTCEGLIRLESLPTDRYEYDEKMFTLYGHNRSFKLGESIRIQVAAADVATKKVSFALYED